MRKFLALLSVNLRAMLTTSVQLGGNKKRAASGLGALIFMALLSLYLSGMYSFLFASQLAPVGMLSLLFLLMPVMAVVIGLIFTLFSAQGIVFGGRDNDLMLSLPISAFTLMLARTLALYLENLIFTLFVLIPAGVVYLAFSGQASIWFFLALIVGTLFLALLPTFLALLCGFVMAWISSKFTRKALFSTLLYFGFFGLLMVFMFRLNYSMNELALYASGLRSGFSGWGLPFLLLEQAVCGGSPLALLALCALCLLPFLAAVWLFGKRYRHIVTGLTARGARSDYKLVHVSAASQRQALLQKEARRFFGTPIFIFNAGFGLILMLVAAVASLIMRGQLNEILSLLLQQGFALPILPLLSAAVCFMLSTVAITASSISLEGKQLWILKEAPIPVQLLFKVKAGFQLLLALPCLSVSVICFGIAFSLPLLELALLLAVCVAYAVLTALFGLYVNLCFPRLDAPNDTVVVKQSASAMITTFAGMGLVLVAVGVYFLTEGLLGYLGATLLWGLLFALAAALFFQLLRTKGVRLFAQLTES